jgi:hypothetical protein
MLHLVVQVQLVLQVFQEYQVKPVLQVALLQ